MVRIFTIGKNLIAQMIVLVNMVEEESIRRETLNVVEWEPADWSKIVGVADEIRNLMSYGFNNAEIARMTGYHRATIQRYAAWLRKEYKRQQRGKDK